MRWFVFGLAVCFGLSALSVVEASGDLPPLPVSRAPFERTEEVSRRPVSLVTWPFHPHGGWILLGEERLTTWAEFRSGDKSVVANGYNGLIHHVGRTGFGKLLFYRGGSETTSPADRQRSDPYGREFLAWMEMRVLDGSKFYTRYMECYSNATLRVEEEAKRVGWSRPCKGAKASYSLAPVGDGMLALEWETPAVPVEFRLYLCGNSTNGVSGVENGTRLYINRNSETERIEFVFPDGTVMVGRADPSPSSGAMGSSRPTGSNEPIPDYVWRTDAASGRIMIDLCGTTAAKSGADGVRALPSGVIDFNEIDALDVPRDPTGNLLANGSFEQELTGWNYWWGGEPWYMVAATGEPLESITDEAKVGDKALRMRRSKTRDKYECLQSMPMSLEPGVEHMLSAWVKRAAGEQGTATVTISADPAAKRFNAVTRTDGLEAKLVVPLADDEWHFVEMPFVSECGDCKVVLDGRGAAVVVDGVRVERAGTGEQGTVGRAAPARRNVEARLETSNPDNLLHFGDAINARLVLSGPDGAKGAVRVTVRNFYNETVFKKAFKFKLPKDKVLPLDFDSERLGTGVFVLGLEFVLGDKHYRAPYQRFAVIKPLDGTHPTADFYLQLNWNEKSSNAEKLAAYSRDLGIMATNWRTNSRFADTNAPEAQLRRKYGIVNRLHILSVELPEMYPDLCKPGMPYHPKSLTNAVPEKVAFIEKAAYEAGMKAAPDDNWWAFYNEEDAEVAPIRYAKTHEERLKACEDWFPYQYACWKGLKRAFDERGIKLMYAPTHGCGNYNPDWHGRDTIDCYMEVANAHGFRYDFIAIHTYRAIDGSFLGRADRDENAARLLSRLAHYGYPETTPIMFSEGFNVLPFSIPQWGALAFADFYPHGWTASLDLGWREFLQAGEMARLYIMDLKYWPRLMNSHSWQNRLVADAQMSPVMWNMVPNTLGHLLPSPKFLGDVKRDDWRAYVFRQGDYGVAAVWTNERQAELGRNKGMTLKLRLSQISPERSERRRRLNAGCDSPTGGGEGSRRPTGDVRFVDLMGNRRAAPPENADGTTSVPLTPAPLFIVSRDAEGLLKALGNVNR